MCAGRRTYWLRPKLLTSKAHEEADTESKLVETPYYVSIYKEELTTSANEAPPVARHGAPVYHDVNISSTLKQHQKLTEKACQEAQNDKSSEIIHKGCWDPEYGIYEERDYVRRISAYCGNSG